MPTALQSYTVLLSRPSDANHYTEIAAEALEAINHQHSLSTGIHFHLLDWTKDSYADSGAEPQQLLNRQIVDKADIVLAIFKERMGTPTQRFDSGTEEEIMLALEAHKTVQAYFWQPPKGITPADPAQYERLKSFKVRISDSLIYATFSDEQELRKKVTHDFTRRMFELEDEKPVRRPTLGLATIGPDGKPSRQLAPQPPALGGGYNPKALDDSVRSAFEKVFAVELLKPEPQESPRAEGESPLSSAFANFQIQLAPSIYSESLLGGIESAGVKEDDRALVTSVLGELGIEVPRDLFYVGELQHNKMLTYSLAAGDDLQGSDEEKARYYALEKLVSACKSRVEYSQFLKSMRSLVGLPLLIKNNGSAPATHVLVEVFIPKSLYVPIACIPMPTESFIGRELNNVNKIASFAGLPFEIPESYEYRSYDDSRVRGESGASIPPVHARTPGVYPYYEPSALNLEDFREEVEYRLEDIAFKPAPGEDFVAVAVSFDRIQQNASYAFPAILPLKATPLYKLRYRINADELDEPIEGNIEFEVKRK